MGNYITQLIPCLVPGAKNNLDQRFNLNDEKINWIKEMRVDNDLDNIDEFTLGIPKFCNFVPTEEILRQLIFRACEVHSVIDLWEGYEAIWNVNGEVIGYKWLNFQDDD